MKELVKAVADMDWGSKGATLLASRFSSAAQNIRDYAEQLAAEADSHSQSLQGLSASLQDARVNGWSGPAETRYSQILWHRAESGRQISSELNESAALLRQAGQEMAAQLEGFASHLAGLGALFDSALDAFADGYEKVEDALDDIFDSPLAGIQHQINDFKSNPLLGFAESLG